MKFYWKIFIIFFILLSVTFSVFGTWMIRASFQSSLQREIDMGMTHNELYRTALRSIADSMPAGYFTKQGHSMADLVKVWKESAADQDGTLQVYDESKNLIYSDQDDTGDLTLLDRVDSENRVHQVCQKGETHYLRTVSYMVVSENLRGYYIETQTNLDEIYRQRQDKSRRYEYIVCIVLLCCAVLSFLLSYILTKPVRQLSMTARLFSQGNLEQRITLRGEDEISLLAEDFNYMADRLQEKMHQLEEHAKNQEDFTTAFAHELKTPLTSIIGYSEMLRSLSLSEEEQLVAADYIYSEGKRLESLSYKLLGLFQIQKGELMMAPVSMVALGEAVKRVTEQNLKNKNMQLDVSMEPGEVTGEADLLISLFSNLIDNGKKASEEGQHIQMTGKTMEHGYQIVIEDHGKGIAKDEIEKIFKPFYMVDKSRSRKEGGAGLGMTLCQEIIKQHGAACRVESEPGRGTRVIIEFTGEVTV